MEHQYVSKELAKKENLEVSKVHQKRMSKGVKWKRVKKNSFIFLVFRSSV